MEATDPLTTVEPFLPALNSRPGPVCVAGEVVFQPAISGKYASHSTSSTSDPLSGYSTASFIDHSPLFNRTLGRIDESTTEAPYPPTTVEPLPSSANSRPSPVCVGGDGVFQTAVHGKYTLDLSNSPPDCFIDSSTHVQPTMIKLSTSIYYQNVRGLRTKTNQLQLALSSCDYDILVFTETWLRPDIGNAEISSEYAIFRCDRSTSTSQFLRGGGVLIAVKNRFQCEPVPVTDCEQIEQIAVRIKLQNSWLYVLAIYLPPNSSSDLYSAHSLAVQRLAGSTSGSDIILSVGDYNLPNLHWQLDEDVNGYLPSNASTEQELTLVEAIFATGLQQINSYVNINGRLLDLAFANLPEHLDLIEPSVPLLPIDTHHTPFVVLLDIIRDVPAVFDDETENLGFNFQRCDFGSLNNALSSVRWELQSVSTVDDALTIFYDKLYEILQEHVPRKRCTSNSIFNKPWWTAELRNLRNVLRKSRNRYFCSRSTDDKIQLRDVENRYSTLLLSTYDNYVARIQSSVKEDPSLFWDFVKRQRSNNRIPVNVDYAGKTAGTNNEAADLFATFFESVFTRVSPVPRFDRFQNTPSFDISIPMFQLSVEEVLQALEDLDGKKGPGADGLSPLLFKNCAATLVHPITDVFNRSLVQMKFPSVWKKAVIVPIHKSGSCLRVENYRGVSLLCCLSKVLETFIHKILYNAALPIISNSQHGFVKKRSTTTNLMSYVTEVSREVESRRQVDSIYIDFAKAFDTVPHLLTIEKMKHLGFPEWIMTWLSSYLSDRTAFVTVNSARSSMFEISSGVPQGSVLGPLIFIIFVNDLYQLLSSCKLSFADDLKFYRVIASALDCIVMQEDIDALLVWCSDNGMRINNSKCKVISFTRRNAPFTYDYTIGSAKMERVQSICDLGVTIDSKLRFNEHVAITIAKAWSALGFIRRHASDFTDVYALKTLFCALVRSILEYAAPVWSPYHLTHTLRIERVQKQFVWFALRHLPWTDPANLPHYPDRCQLINLETLTARRAKLQQLFIFDLISGNLDCPALLGEIPINVPPRRFRNSPLLAIPLHRTGYGQNSPFCSCLKAFNDVSSNFDFNMSKQMFKNRIRN